MFNPRFCHRNQTLKHDGKIRKTPPKIPKVQVEDAQVDFFIFLFFQGIYRLFRCMQNSRLTACFEPTKHPSVWITAESECRAAAVGLKPLRLPRTRLILAPPESSFCFNDSWSCHRQLPQHPFQGTQKGVPVASPRNTIICVMILLSHISGQTLIFGRCPCESSRSIDRPHQLSFCQQILACSGTESATSGHLTNF